MNHYERLKVSPDAPPEVIRAAYRALAAKHHPDRKGGDAGPNEHAHEAMAALNAAYLVLMDPSQRDAYDRTLSGAAASSARPEPAAGRGGDPDAAGARTGFMNSRFWSGAGGASAAPAAAGTGPGADAQDTRVDIDWLLQTPSQDKPWYSDARWMVAGLSAAIVVVGGLLWWGVQEAERVAFDRSLAQRGGASAPVDATTAGDRTLEADLAMARAALRESAAAEGATSATSAASVPDLSPEEMARLSDEELIALMPKLLDDPAPVPASKGHQSLLNPHGRAHPLDGRPLGLKIEPQMPLFPRQD